MNRYLLISLSIFLLLAAGVEFGYRTYLVQKFSHAKFNFTLVDGAYRIEDVKRRGPEDGLYLKNIVRHFRSFDQNHRVLYKSVVKTNSYGYRSGYEYSSPAAEELRIAVLGDSMTAGLKNDFPWTDVVQMRLDGDFALKERLGVARIRVMNFGVVGAGFETMTQVFWDHARRFDPHLVILNFITPDIFRNRMHIAPLDDLNLAPRIYRGLIDISTDDIKAKTAVICETPEFALGSPGCKPSTQIFVDGRHVFDRAGIKTVRLKLSSGFLWSKLWRSTYPYSISAAMGRPFVLDDRGFADIFRPLPSAEAPKPKLSEKAYSLAAAAIRRLRQTQKNLLILHDPTSGELLAGVARPDPAQRFAREAARPVCYMADFLPQGENPETIKSWFNLPHDGHYNNRGATVYGESVARLLMRLLMAAGEGGRIGDTVQNAVCGASPPPAGAKITPPPAP
jgi:hypothetical protein